MEFKDRLKKIRTEKGLSQSQLARAIEVHVTNISRYERGENMPTSEVLAKLAGVLGVTADFLMDGSVNDKAQIAISDKELLNQFEEVEKLSQEDKHLIKTFIDAFLTKRKIQQLAV
jgi:transcriptional regulator with XRE-family HTH domain